MIIHRKPKVNIKNLEGKMVKGEESLAPVKNVLKNGAIQPMLHFELYKNTESRESALTQEGGKVNGKLFSRRKDLKDPTEFLNNLKSKLVKPEK